MTQQPPPEPTEPPGMTGFTVSDGFSVIPSTRPTTVTVAAWTLWIVAAAGLVVAAVIGVGEVRTMSDVPVLMTSSGFHNALTLTVAAIVTIVLAQQLRGGAPTAQLGAFVVLGTAAVLFGSMAIGEFVALPFYDGDAPSVLESVVLSAGAVAAAVPVVLLALNRSNDWFRDRRREVEFDAPSVAVSARPPLLITGIGFLVLTGLLHIAGIAVYAAQLATLGVDVSAFYADLLGRFVAIGLPVLLLLTATIGLGVGARAFLVLSYGLCGYFCFTGLVAVVQQGLLSSVTTGFEWSVLLNITLTFLAGAAATVALFALAQRGVIDWFDERRAPTPSP